jgi:hypothetical protein
MRERKKRNGSDKKIAIETDENDENDEDKERESARSRIGCRSISIVPR